MTPRGGRAKSGAVRNIIHVAERPSSSISDIRSGAWIAFQGLKRVKNLFHAFSCLNYLHGKLSSVLEIYRLEKTIEMIIVCSRIADLIHYSRMLYVADRRAQRTGVTKNSSLKFVRLPIPVRGSQACSSKMLPLASSGYFGLWENPRVG